MRSTQGPIARSTQDLKMIMSLLFRPDMHKFDPWAPPTVFREHIYDLPFKSKIKIGFIETLPTVLASKANQRAVKIAKEVLEKRGYELVKVDIPIEELHSYNDVLTGLAGNYTAK